MELPNLFSKDKPTHKKFIAIYLTVETVQAAFWKVVDGEIVLGSISPAFMFTDETSCLPQTDLALQGLDNDADDVSEVVLAFDGSWTKNGVIAPEKKNWVQKLMTGLSLKPVGFVLAGEALTSWMVKKDALASNIFVELTPHYLNIILVIRGKFIGVQQVGRSADTIGDIKEGLARFEAEVGEEHLPPTFKLCSATGNEDELQGLVEELNKEKWGEKFKFLHPPVVQVGEKQLVLNAVVQEAGLTVARQQGIEVEVKTDALPLAKTKEKNKDEIVQPKEENFGFNELKDPADVPDGDNFEPAAWPQKAVDEEGAYPLPTDIIEPSQPELVNLKAEKTKKKKRGGFKLPKIFHGHVAKAVSLGMVGGLLILFVLASFLLRQQVRAKVEIVPKTKPITTQTQLFLDPKAAEANVAEKSLPAKRITKEVSGKETTDTTGVKLIGESAKGKVTITNKSSTSKSLKAGTTLAKGNLTFSLDGDVNVSAATSSSTTTGETISYGKSEVDVTAKQIGPESNLAKDTQLTVGGFNTDDVVGVVVELKGGTSREVRAVAQADQQKLKSKLQAELVKQGGEELNKDAGQGKYVVATGEVKVISSDFDAKVGDEVNSLGLEMTVEVVGLSYQVSDLKPLTNQLLAGLTPDGYVLSGKDPQILSAPDTATRSGQVVLSAQITGIAEPEIDLAALTLQIKGMSKTKANEHLLGNDKISKVNISFKPALLSSLLNRLPNNIDRIELSIKHE